MTRREPSIVVTVLMEVAFVAGVGLLGYWIIDSLTN